MMALISGVIGIGMLVTFLGFMVVWVKAPPLIVIVLIVVACVLYDFVNELRTQSSKR